MIVGVAGFEPTTSWSQTRRDNRTTLHPEGDHDRIRTCDRLLRRQMLYPTELRDLKFKKLTMPQKIKSGWQDSNLRPPGPKPGAITGLRYTPNKLR